MLRYLGLVLVLGLGGCSGNLDAGSPVRPGGGSARSGCQPGIPQTSRIPRLTHGQYDNSIRELFGDSTLTPSSGLAPESAGSLSARGWEGYQTAASQLAATALGDPAVRGRVLGCEPTGDGRACAQTFLESFGRRAFRRPLEQSELDRYLGAYDARDGITANGTFDEAVEVLLTAMLQSPSFLLRPERSTNRRNGAIPLDDWEVASRLSFMLWNSTPDDALLDAAAAGQLSDAAGIRAQAERMLADPRARAMVRDFHALYLGISGTEAPLWREIMRDTEDFPYFTPEMVPAMTEETLAFVDHVVFDLEGGFHELMMEPTGFVNRDLAPAYGLDPASFGDDLEPVALDPTRRAGVFTRLGYLASHAVVDRTSPILRGAFLQKEILCRDLGNPPNGAETTPLPEITPDLVTNRQRTEVQTSPAACASCHTDIINPTGFGFEHYDALGAWQDADNGAPVDAADTVLIGRDTVTFDGAVELSAAIAESPAAHECYSLQFVEYLMRRDATPQDVCVVEEFADRLGDEDYSIRELLLDLTELEQFTTRAITVEGS